MRHKNRKSTHKKAATIKPSTHHLSDDMKYDILMNAWSKGIADQMTNPGWKAK